KLVDWPPEEDMRHRYHDLYDWCMQHRVLTVLIALFLLTLLIYNL
ncbi:unnamed protein product, partial [marine sediment metagenome]